MNKTALLLQEAGFLRVSSKDIAEISNVSQGSIFLHFNTKENLLTEVIEEELEKFETEIKNKCITNTSSDNFVKSYIDIIILHEGMLSRIYKDIGYLPDVIKKHVQNLDSLIKNLFFENYRENSEKKISIVDTFIAIESFLAQVEKNLMDKEIYSDFNSIIKQKRGRLIKLYKMLMG